MTSTYDPDQPDPAYRPPRRRTRIVRGLCVALIVFAVLPLLITLPHWLLVALAVISLGIALTVFGILLLPRLLARADRATDPEEVP
jgi:fatty acid desaturase